MLKFFRQRKVYKRIMYALAILIIPAFVIWGSASSMRNKQQSRYAGKMFNKPVSWDAFQSAYANWMIQMRVQFGDKANEVMRLYMDPMDATWDRLILMHEVKRRKIRVRNEDVLSNLLSLPFLQKNGQFDRQTYNLFLQYGIGVQARIFEEHLRENLMMAQVFEQTTATVTVSSDEIRRAYEAENNRTRVKYVSFPFSGFKDAVTIPDNDLNAYYETSAEQFKIPPQINVAYVGVDITEDSTQEQKIKEHDRMKAFFSSAKKTGFDQAARESGLSIKETGLFGLDDPVPGFGWQPQLSTLLFDLSLNTTSKIIETTKGVYVFHVKDKRDAFIPAFADIKDKVKDAYILEKSKEVAEQKAKEFLSLATAPNATFEKAALDQNLTIKETPLFSREEYISELGMAQSFKEAAFSLKPDETASSLITSENAFLVIKSIETVFLGEEKFTQEKDAFARELLDRKKSETFSEFFKELKKQANVISYIQPETKEQQPAS